MSVRQVPLYIQGTITDEGRVDLDVTINRRPRRAPLLVALLSPPSGGLLTPVTRLIAGQLVHLRVTGTVANPSIQLEPPPILSNNALRFLFGDHAERRSNPVVSSSTLVATVPILLLPDYPDTVRAGR